ncbi:MAG: M12 family metallo-peptidase, partial [Planctomycetota bacterium]
MPVTYTSAAAFRLLLASVLFVLLIAPHCGADVFVLTNRTRQTVQVQISPESQAPYLLRLASGEVRPIRSDEPLQVAFDSGAERAAYVLDANSAYYFGVARDGRLSMHRIGLGDDESTAKGRPLPPTPEPDESFVIDVMLLVDDDEPTRPILWEKKLRDRAAKASRLLTKHAGVALRVVGVSTWNSNNSTTDFDKSLREFEKQIDPSPARLAIGFTSQYEVPRGRIHLGGTRGPMARHIMIREWSRHVSEQERLELLLHELGHFLGATHSPERDSVMRPVLGDRQARVRGFDVRFDAVNTLIISMVAEEMQRRGVDRFSDLSDGTRRRLAQVYSTLAKAMPYDPSSSRFVARTKARRLTSQSGQIRQIMQAIVRAAKRG